MAKLCRVHKFVRNLITEWRRLQLPFEDATIIVAVSGGADSVALLLGLAELQTAKKLRNRVVAAHFNHKLRGEESDIDEQFVKMLCERLSTELVVGSTHIGHSGNLEQNARDARYDFLGKTAESLEAQAVLTAHTQNDQAETLLMNLIRGSGPGGLGGMRTIREFGVNETRKTAETGEAPGTSGVAKHSETDEQAERSSAPLLPFSPSLLLLVRPLLDWARRQDTEAYCRDREVEYRYDSMNEDLDFTRVRIRKLLLPMLEEFNPNIIETLANTAFLMQGRAVTGGGGGHPAVAADAHELTVKELKGLEKTERCAIIRDWLTRKRGNSRGLSMKHIEALERLALSRKSGRMVEIPGGAGVVKKGGQFVYEDLVVEKRPDGN